MESTPAMVVPIGDLIKPNEKKTTKKSAKINPADIKPEKTSSAKISYDLLGASSTLWPKEKSRTSLFLL